MKPEVKDAVTGWCAGFLIGAIPFAAHIWAILTIEPADGVPIRDGWTIDILFIGMTLAATSIFSVVNQYRRTGTVLEGRAVPGLVVVNALFIVMASIHYAALVSGHGRPHATPSAIGTMFGSGILSLYLELVVAARVLDLKPVRKSRAAKKSA